MEPSDFECKKCNSGKNIQFTPKKFQKISLEKTARCLEAKGAEIELETSSLLIARLEGKQLDINQNCKTKVKTENPEEAKKTFSKALECFKY